jgi:hypothetical protein
MTVLLVLSAWTLSAALAAPVVGRVLGTHGTPPTSLR